jgi:hypothetical protein
MSKKYSLKKVDFGRGKEVTAEVGQGLQKSLQSAKEIDVIIAKSLTGQSVVARTATRIPFVGKWVGKGINRVKSIQPLEGLESQLRTALNQSLNSLRAVGIRASDERERIEQLQVIYQQALDDNWTTSDFFRFLKEHTDIEFELSGDNGMLDMTEVFAEIETRQTDEKREQKQKEFQDWLKQHLNLSRQYLDSMYALCLVGSEWIAGMSRSYYDLTQLRGGMEEIRTALQNLTTGADTSVTSQTALRQYGTSYVNGMRHLVAGYQKMCSLKDAGSTEFRTSLRSLENELQTVSESHRLENASTTALPDGTPTKDTE